MECAKSFEADYIVTRNVADYSISEIKAIMPKRLFRFINLLSTNVR